MFVKQLSVISFECFTSAFDPFSNEYPAKRAIFKVPSDESTGKCFSLFDG